MQGWSMWSYRTWARRSNCLSPHVWNWIQVANTDSRWATIAHCIITPDSRSMTSCVIRTYINTFSPGNNECSFRCLQAILRRAAHHQTAELQPAPDCWQRWTGPSVPQPCWAHRPGFISIRRGPAGPLHRSADCRSGAAAGSQRSTQIHGIPSCGLLFVDASWIQRKTTRTHVEPIRYLWVKMRLGTPRGSWEQVSAVEQQQTGFTFAPHSITDTCTACLCCASLRFAVGQCTCLWWHTGGCRSVWIMIHFDSIPQWYWNSNNNKNKTIKMLSKCTLSALSVTGFTGTCRLPFRYCRNSQFSGGSKVFVQWPFMVCTSWQCTIRQMKPTLDVESVFGCSLTKAVNVKSKEMSIC